MFNFQEYIRDCYKMTSLHDTSLVKFLASRKVEGRHPYSLTGMGAITGRWMVSDEDYPKFLNELHNYLFVLKLRPLNLVEQRRADKFSPLLVDLDFKYSPTGQLFRRFTDEHIGNFIAGFTEILKKFYDLKTLSMPPRFFVCLRPMPYEQKKAGERIIKDGIHIISPDLILNVEHQSVLRAAILDAGIVSESFEGTEYINADKDVYDEAISSGRNGWLFYGESKPDIPPYLLANVYEYDPATDELSYGEIEDFESRDLIEMFSIRYNLEPTELPIRQSMIGEWETLKKPKSEIAAPAPPKVAEEDLENEIVETSTAVDTVSGKIPEWAQFRGYDEGQIELAKTLARECLSKERMDGFHTWLEVGWCLHTIDSGLEMFDVWMEVSAKSDKFRMNNINALRADWQKNWNRGESDSKLTLASLRFWAKLDNPQRYKEIVDDDLIDKIQNKVYECNHHHVGLIMHEIFSGHYRSTADSKSVDWYEFKNHVWRKLQKGIEIRNHISTKLIALIAAAQNRQRSKFATSVDSKNFKNSEDYKDFEALIRFEKQLYNSGFKDSVMKECEGIFYEDGFSEKMNLNPHLVGCANGILDLQGPDEDNPCIVFRKGQPDDMVSFQMGRCPDMDAIPYIPYEEIRDDPIYEEIDDFFEKLFHDREERDYVWRLLASCLEGANQAQEFYTWTGRGGNGKSKITELMRITFGEYACSLQATALTRKRGDAGAAAPELIAIRNKRFIYLSEPDENEPLNTAQMKQFSGEDYMMIRGLYKEPVSFKIAGKLVIMCNKLIPINSQDGGTWRRIRVVPFMSKFVKSDSPEYNPEKCVFYQDEQLDRKLRKWRVHFFSKLVHIYNTDYRKRKLAAPKIVMAAVTDYKESYDSFAKFYYGCVRKGGKAIGNDVTFQEIRRAYLQWYSDEGSSSGAKKFNDIDLKKRLIEELGDPIIENKKEVFRHVVVFMSSDDATRWDQGLDL